jgi:hypothetical protein
VENSRLNKLKREKFIKPLFLCLFLLSHDSVDKTLQAFIFKLYRESKPCANLAVRLLDNQCKPVDEWCGYPQRQLYPAFEAAYQPTSAAVIHRA